MKEDKDFMDTLRKVNDTIFQHTERRVPDVKRRPSNCDKKCRGCKTPLESDGMVTFVFAEIGPNGIFKARMKRQLCVSCYGKWRGDRRIRYPHLRSELCR